MVDLVLTVLEFCWSDKEMLQKSKKIKKAYNYPYWSVDPSALRAA